MQLTIDHLNINFSTQGRGPDLLLLHGWGCDHQIWQPILPFLTTSHRVTSLDLPGFGSSSTPPHPWSLSNYAQLINQFIQDLSLKRPIIVGHSLGGAIAIILVVKKPKLSRKLILVSSSGVRRPSLKKTLGWLAAKSGKILLSPLPEKIQNELRNTLYHTLKETDYLQSGKMKQTYLNIINQDLTPLLSQVFVPTLLIWGDQDTDTPLAKGKQMHQLIPRSQLKIIHHTGHFLFIDQSEQFCQIVNNFCKS